MTRFSCICTRLERTRVLGGAPPAWPGISGPNRSLGGRRRSIQIPLPRILPPPTPRRGPPTQGRRRIHEAPARRAKSPRPPCESHKKCLTREIAPWRLRRRRGQSPSRTPGVLRRPGAEPAFRQVQAPPPARPPPPHRPRCPPGRQVAPGPRGARRPHLQAQWAGPGGPRQWPCPKRRPRPPPAERRAWPASAPSPSGPASGRALPPASRARQQAGRRRRRTPRKSSCARRRGARLEA